ncbi:hypothetical protein SEA_LIBERTYBELL_29 [Streptomyces phage LibertyBell]|nr:hypothetical protein SEA_LIBERTYBELL_29 [Streptomyces phage LibertyBell]
MLRRLGKVSYFLGTTLSITYSVMSLNHLRKHLAKKDEVNSAAEYVAVRFARGDYMKPDGVNTMIYDYKFFNVIKTRD